MLVRRRPSVTAYRARLAEPFDYVPKGLERGTWVSADGARCAGYRWNEFLFIADTDTKGRSIWIVADRQTGKTLTWTGSLNACHGRRRGDSRLSA